MKTRCILACSMLAAPALLASPALGQWIDMENQTATRLISDPAVGSNDGSEKDYSWGDLNNNGWIDLVVMRKQPFTTAGRRTNVLFINFSGVLRDRTLQFATASSVVNDEGFLTPTNDRDSVIVDVDNDGWRDVVTATTLSDGQPKHISHPRIYMNRGELRGAWLGLRFENNRFPQLAGTVPSGPHAGFPHAPRFCSVAAGDVTGNGYADLYFGDYDSGGGQTLDFNNRFLANQGSANPGVFADESNRFGNYNYGGSVGVQSQLFSAFGAASVIADINGNGLLDIVKQTALVPPQHVAVHYNNPANPGTFTHSGAYHAVYSLAPYFVSAGDLNNNGRLDLVITDDGVDRYLLNQGNNALGQVNWSASLSLPEYQTPGQNRFGSNSIIADLDGDGWNDIIIADVDVDESGCNRHANIYRNNANGPNVTFTRDWGNIPLNMMKGVYDVAVFDLTGSGWLDLVVGRCSSSTVGTTEVWVSLNEAVPACPADLNGSGAVDVQDLLILLAQWGPCPGAPGECPADLNGSGAVDVQDLLILLADWGPCP